MVEKGKGKKTSAKDEVGVMAGLSTTRPPRIGGHRRGAGTTRRAPAATPAEQGDGAAPTAAKAPATRAAKASAKSAGKGAPKPASKSAAKPASKTAAKPAAKSATRSASKGAAAPTAKGPAKASAKPAARKPSQPAGMPSVGAVQEVRETPTRKPRPVRAGAPGLKRATAEAAKQERPAARTAPPPPPAGAPHAPSGTELVTTAIQAAGELAQIGVTVGGQILKRALDRLPKP